MALNSKLCLDRLLCCSKLETLPQLHHRQSLKLYLNPKNIKILDFGASFLSYFDRRLAITWYKKVQKNKKVAYCLNK
jgi:hypothetical protein